MDDRREVAFQLETVNPLFLSCASVSSPTCRCPAVGEIPRQGDRSLDSSSVRLTSACGVVGVFWLRDGDGMDASMNARTVLSAYTTAPNLPRSRYLI